MEVSFPEIIRKGEQAFLLFSFRNKWWGRGSPRNFLLPKKMAHITEREGGGGSKSSESSESVARGADEET